MNSKLALISVLFSLLFSCGGDVTVFRGSQKSTFTVGGEVTKNQIQNSTIFVYRGTNPQQLYIDGLGGAPIRVEKDLQTGNLSGSQSVAWGPDLDNETTQDVESVSGFISSTYLSVTVKAKELKKAKGEPDELMNYTYEFSGGTD